MPPLSPAARGPWNICTHHRTFSTLLGGTSSNISHAATTSRSTGRFFSFLICFLVVLVLVRFVCGASVQADDQTPKALDRRTYTQTFWVCVCVCARACVDTQSQNFQASIFCVKTKRKTQILFTFCCIQGTDETMPNVLRYVLLHKCQGFCCL